MKLRRAAETVAVALAVDAGVSVIKAASRRLPSGAAQPEAVATPAKAPPRGVKQVVTRVFTDIGQDRILAEAASVTYYTLLAIFPAIAALISLYGLVADPSAIGKHLAALQGVVPGGGMQIIEDQIHALTASPNKALGFGFVVGLLTSLWSANAATKSLFDALNVVHEKHETRSFVHLTWLSLAFTLGALAFVILAIGAVVVVPAILAFVGLGIVGDLILGLGRWPLMLVAIMGFLALTYRYGPDRSGAKWCWISWGSAFAGVTWIVASAGFSYYAANFGNYNKTYGSLGAAVGFMTWIWISTIIVLVGAELNAEIGGEKAR